MQWAFDRVHGASFAPALSSEVAVARVTAQSGVDFSRARARCGFARGHLLDVVVYLPAGRGDLREQEAAEELVQLLVGDELSERWIGRVSVTPAARGGLLTVLNTRSEERGALPLAELHPSACAAVEGLQRGLAQQAAATSKNCDDWVLFELEPEPAVDYAAQDDLVLASTRLPELKKSFLRGDPFFSGRFTPAGDLFAYLKYESRERIGEARLRERGILEKALTRALHEGDGSVFGVGVGLRYSYIDLAISNAACVETKILPALRSLEISERSWLLFHDTPLVADWIGVYAGTPAPFF